MRIFIEPTEPLLFRNGRSFDAGESNFAESIFPPTPETIQGAIRAMIAAHTTLVDKTMSIATRFSTDALTQLIGNQNSYGRFRITGLALGKRTKEDGTIKRLFPAPAHLMKVRFQGADTPKIIQLKREKRDDVISNIPAEMQYLMLPDLGGEKLDGKPKPPGWITEDNLQIALNSQTDVPELEAESDIYTLESRLGIGMQNDTKTTRTGYLYQMQVIRMQVGYGFVVDVRLSEEGHSEKLISDALTQETLGLPERGWLILGGEQRAAYFTVLGLTSQEGNIEARRPGKIVYLATPAYFTHGWQPPMERFTSAGKLIAAAINNPVLIGGWQLNPGDAGGSSKITRRCVPAGSVYFFDKPVTVTQPLTEYGWQIGYGIAYTGDYES